MDKDFNGISLMQGECLEKMKEIENKSIDMILCDLPYNTTGMKWDKLIPAKYLWEQYERIIKDNGAIVLFSQQPFTTYLINSNIKLWKYNWIWIKEMGTNFMNANYCPLKVTEDICVFGKSPIAFTKEGRRMNYHPIKTKGRPYICKNGNKQDEHYAILHSNNKVSGHITINDGDRFPTNILKFNRDKNKFHPTQKPVALLEYLIKTYTNEGETVLDNTMGSGSTGVACVNTNRKFVGIEMDENYFNIARNRIDEAIREKEQDLFK